MKIHEVLRQEGSFAVLDETGSTPHKRFELTMLGPGGDDFYVVVRTTTGKEWAGRSCSRNELDALREILTTGETSARWHVGSNSLPAWTFEFLPNGGVTLRVWNDTVTMNNWGMRRVRMRIDTNDQVQWDALAQNISEVLTP